VTNGRARATGPQSRDLTQARGCLLAPRHEWALARGMAFRGMAGRSTPEQFATPYGGLCEHARTPMRPQDDDDPNDGRRPRQLAQPQVRDRLAPCPPAGRSRRDHERIRTAALSRLMCSPRTPPRRGHRCQWCCSTASTRRTPRTARTTLRSAADGAPYMASSSALPRSGDVRPGAGVVRSLWDAL
jgi:hypothetical protein